MNRRFAFLLMLDAHRGQVDKAGEPYLFHPLAVEEQVAPLGEDFAVVALLHDVWEDTEAKIRGAGEVGPDEGLTPVQYLALHAITKKSTESYADYLRRVRENFIASVVKWADFNHNLSMERQQGIDPELAKNLATKYERGRLILLGEEQ